MAKAIFSREFNATDVKLGVSIRVRPSVEPQLFPSWVIDLAVAKGAAERVDPPRKAKAAKEDTGG